jgi:hypothetical protein
VRLEKKVIKLLDKVLYKLYHAIKNKIGEDMMKNYKIKVNVEIVECEEPLQNEPVKLNDGSFELNISDKTASSIDNCEKALLLTNYPAIRSAISKHLTEISKKKLLTREREN